ncbi:TonB-dependent siderophore receptor [Pedobacter sp. PWIIR3]
MKRILLRITFSTLLAMVTLIAFGQSGSIKGKVLTADGKAAAGISIALSGTTLGTSTNSNGEYKIGNIKPGSYTLKVSAVGLNTQELSVTVAAKTTATADFTLSENLAQLKEVNISQNKTNRFAVKSSDYVAKMPLNNLENPQSYAVISKELLLDQQVFTVEDAVKNVTGIHKLWDASGRAGIGGAIFSLRGFATTSKLRNGVSGNVNSTIDASNIERIEVIKGPSAALFGSSLTSYGGLINRVTKVPYDSLGGSVSYSGGTYGLNRIAADFNAPVNKEKSVLLRINTAYNAQQSFQDFGFSRSIAFAPSVSYKASDKLSFNLDAELFSSKGNNFQAVYIYPGAKVSALGVDNAKDLKLNYKSAYQTNSLVNYTNNSNLFGQMNLELNSQWKLQTNVSINTSDSHGRMAYFYLLPNAAATGVPTAVGADYLARMVWTPVIDDFAAEIQPNLIGDFSIGGLRNRLTVGLDFFTNKNNYNYQRFNNTLGADNFDVVSLVGPNPNYYEFNEAEVAGLYATKTSAVYSGRTATNTYSAYFSDVLNVTDELLVSVGLRFDNFKNVGVYNPVTNQIGQGYEQNAFSPKFGLVYQLIKDKLSLFGNYQNGFTNKTGVDKDNNRFKPEQANQTEGGIKADLFDGKLSGTISYYDIKVKDVVRGDLANPLFSIQDGTQKSKGWEAEFNINPFEGLNIIAGYAYNDSKYTDISANLNGFRPVTSGPKKVANAYINYKIPYGTVAGLGFGLGGNYAGESVVIANATQGTFVLPEYTVLNASAFYDVKKFRLGISANNFTDKHYWVGYTTINAQMPRSFIASATLKF